MVEQVIEEVAESFEATWRERGELADRVEALEKQLAELRKREDLLTQTLVAAEQAASDMRERARREAEAIITEAHSEARAISRTAQVERERLVNESRRIEGMLRGALGMIEERAAAMAGAQQPAAEPPTSVPPAIVPPASEAISAPAAPRPVVLPPVVEEDPTPEPALEAVPDATPSLPAIADAPPESWSREDTREFEPIAPIHVEEPTEQDDDSRTPAAAVLERLPGSESRDFDWGE